jgi:hypothetical protein
MTCSGSSNCAKQSARAVHRSGKESTDVSECFDSNCPEPSYEANCLNTAQRGSHAAITWYPRNTGHGFPMCSSWLVVAVCLVVWPMDRISNADAYTLEQVRRADYATNCGLGFAGLLCDEVMSCEELDYCSGHGMCQRGGFCICDPGWEGATCSQSNCPSGCSGHGSCAATGGCVCDAGFTGVICNQVICLGGGNCTGHGACIAGSGICVCEKGYLGGACDVIDVAQKCSNHGVPFVTMYSVHAFCS